jgi:Holliday junction resolvasome RuvABC ATP-dependent DNA helicase subunit
MSIIHILLNALIGTISTVLANVISAKIHDKAKKKSSPAKDKAL